MDDGKFNIFEAIRDGYVFVGRNWRYLLKVGALPIVAQIATACFLQFVRPEASTIESYLWGLPATTLFAWFSFTQVRLLLLGERMDRPLPQDQNFPHDRKRALRLSVLTSVLFNMGISAAVSLLMAAADSGLWGKSWPVTLGGFFLIGAVVWSLRFALLSILGAVNHPFRPYLQQVRGMMFSLRLLAMGFLCLIPLAILFQIVTALLLGRPADPAEPFKMTDTEQLAILVAGAPLSLAISALLNASSTYVLKQILGKNRGAI